MNRDRKYRAIVRCMMKKSADQAAAIFAVCAAVFEVHCAIFVVYVKEYKDGDMNFEDCGAADEVYHAEYKDAGVKFKDGGAEYQPLI